ncbi:MAG: nickel pincer cofactor biosynthesis protein LarC [Actinomycetes bacterium]|jgi:uncharacterized protein (TIGR00299 family) protein|nr:nickel pincer cofactor biosynthesis protein LarC [Actinomycetes bacterium]
MTNRIAHLDCSSGVSGDKFLGALLDIGEQGGQFTTADLQSLAAALVPEAHIEVEQVDSYGIKAYSVKVSVEGNDDSAIHDTHVLHATPATPVGHDAPSTFPALPHRSWRDIRHLLQATSETETVLTAAAREQALTVFSRLAEAEADVHGVAVDDVHFHEVGAADSIVDIIGVCAGLDALAIDTLYATPPALGSGTVNTQHGVLPVPAPATAALLAAHHIPTAMSQASGELTTPTGAALLTLAAGFGPVPPLTPTAFGFGAGTRDIGQSNICRLLMGMADEAPLAPSQPDATVLLETNIDHIAPEAVAFAGEELLAEGALDVWVTPIAAKKGRAALTLSVLAAPDAAETTAGRVMKLTGTLGVRVSEQPRLIAAREQQVIDTPWGAVRVKVGGGRFRPEHAEIARIAREQHLGYPEVLAELTRLARRQLSA